MADLNVESQNKVILASMNFTSISEQTFTTLLNKCTVHEQSSILKYKHRIDQLRSLLAIIQIKYCFKNYFNLEKDINIIKNPYGKPKVVGWSGDISISHTGDWIFTGICTTGRIGVDIECLNPFPLLKGTEELFLSEKELSFFQANQNSEESKDYLLTMWTLKEAYLKEIGIGLTMINPTSLSFNCPPKKSHFTYQGAKGISELNTYNVDGVAKASVSTSSIKRPSIQFYKHYQNHMLAEML
ncbi:4'-phosphopantetheinyl transferase family protein [Rummeliibacillus pycnus]|uniref:4'-phosphopantetheinyl transferase family protein n=1 Tax=Rummeliibacillus pycnus TaxID=101070 RepID=UPI003D28BAA0